ncbi:class I SAM-dependent methyltransferase [Devosia sp. A8/3-2]|nr:class I SAM-dependent methyltransferase [Devosia sp. A8/3-2]
MSEKTQTDKTIEDFGDQWTRYTENGGFYASQDMFHDIVGPLLAVESLDGARCAEIGAGTGRITNMLLRCGVAHVLAVEPSRASTVLRDNTAVVGDRVTVQQARRRLRGQRSGLYLLHRGSPPYSRSCSDRQAHARGAQAERSGTDLVVRPGRQYSLPKHYGAAAGYNPATASGGQWDSVLADVYSAGALCRALPLAASAHAQLHARGLGTVVGSGRTSGDRRPAQPDSGQILSRGEARQLLEDAGFTDVQLYHRHGYSWTVPGTGTLD